MKTSILTALTACCGLINAQPIEAQSGEELFQQDLVMELSNGEVGLAIRLYQRIVMEFASDRPVAAKALIRIGLAYEARGPGLGSTEAKRAYQRIVSHYPDQREQVIVAQSRLAALTTETVGGGNGEVRRVLQPSALCSDQSEDAIATFEDVNLEVRVRSALLISAQDNLTCRLVSELTLLIADARPDVSRSRRDGYAFGPGVEAGSEYEYSEIEGLVGIQNLTSLTRLTLDFNSITDISALSGLTRLTSLTLNDNSITDIGALSGLTSLTRLHLSRNSITDFDPLSGLTNLTSLHLHENSTSDISAVSGLTNLTHLYVDKNSISDISAVSGLTSLQVLSIDNNSITDISALRELRSLMWLSLNDTPITDISVLSGLTTLTDLRLHRNRNLSNIQPLLDNTGLGAGDIVRLQGTNVSCTDVAALRAKALSANVRETRSTQRIRVGRRQRKRTCWDCEREWKRMVVPLEPGRPSEARQLLRTQR